MEYLKIIETVNKLAVENSKLLELYKLINENEQMDETTKKYVFSRIEELAKKCRSLEYELQRLMVASNLNYIIE
jgi:hypothetical protein